MKLAIVGAGWAGLAAAVRAADLGHRVTIFEASHILGGRARAVVSPRLKTRIDNGQHIMLGAYQETLNLMQRLDVDIRSTIQREPLTLESANGTFKLHVPRLPAPLHLLVALLSSKGLFPRDKWQLLRCMRNLQNRDWKIIPDTTVQDWLKQQRQSIRVSALFWEPLCVAALNTPIKQASAQLFANVLRDSIGSTRSACEVLLSRVDLSTLWPERVEQLDWPPDGGSLKIRRGSVVTRLELDATSGRLPCDGSRATQQQGALRIHDSMFDAAIIACNAPSARRLLETLPVSSGQRVPVQRLMDALADFRYIPIATLTLELASPWNLPRSMYQLHEDRTAKHYGQWLFNCPAFMQPGAHHAHRAEPHDRPPILAHVVISDAEQALAEGEPALVRAITAQLRAQTRRFGTMPDVVGYELIAEKRATFAATPGLIRPENNSPWPQVWLAGDWTNTGYPAVLEGAVRSGHAAAEQLHRAMKER